MQPINYIPQNQPDFMRNFLTGLQAGSAISDMQAKQQEIANAQALKEQYSKDMQDAFKSGTSEAFGQLAIKYPSQREAILAGGKLITEEQQKSAFNDASKIYNSISTGNVDYAKNLLDTKIQAFQNSGKDASDYIELKAQLEKDPKIAQASSAFIASSLNPERFLQIAKAPSDVSEAKSKAEKAEAEARIKIETATDEISKAKATREFEQAKAKKEQIQADTELKTRMAELNFKQAQINKFRVETRNLDSQGKMLSLDLKAALSGLPLPSKKTEGGGGVATEDERKAAGWLAQATNAYNNMLGAMYTKEGKKTGAEAPGVIESAVEGVPLVGERSAALFRGTDRQKFTQAASSLSEALLRAATGAGVNKDEAKQKLEELTPLFTDDEETRKQKLAAIPMYLDSLKSRAGRAAPKDYQVPQIPSPKFSVTTPDGKQFIFPSQNAADEFRKAIGVQ
jgi:hypothetical protein